ncbi:MAG TPA: cytochrome c3 family protein [Spirochaetota bacterium]|nr:cytochrome c3 family protein [Spirochaetota bacterium]
MNRRSTTLFLICSLVISVSFAVAGCKEGTTSINPSPTDVYIINSVNKFVTDSDLKAGVVKTRDLVSDVKISHLKHQKAGVDCFTCHHKKGNDDRIKVCAQCHKGSRGEDEIHDFCIGCHAVKAKGPTMCQDCHLEVHDTK